MKFERIKIKSNILTKLGSVKKIKVKFILLFLKMFEKKFVNYYYMKNVH